MQRIRRKDREAGRPEVAQSRQATEKIMILKPRNKAYFSQAPWVLSTEELMFLSCGVGEDIESPLDCKEIKSINPKGNHT